MAFMKDYEHLKIEMKDIESATNNFDSSMVIGRGGFGRVYKGELSRPEGQIAAAFKLLDRRLGQGNTEFWKEIMMLSKYRHENLVFLIGFCSEGNKMVLVYEYACRRSLDRYLSDAGLTWIQRLKICVGAARGINFLHDPMEEQQRVIHRDIKSANILLDEKWTPKVSDFGLSKAGPANQPQTYLFSNVVGTPGYCDPLYLEMGFLSKESDVYSFGVVLFEVMCGTLCNEYGNGKLTNILVPKWRECYVEEKLDDIILSGLKQQMEPGSLKTFSTITYRCVARAREERPPMSEVVKELEFALQQQEVFEDLRKRVDFEKRVDCEKLIKIADGAKSPLSYVSQSHLYSFFLKGIVVDDGKTWISANMNGEITEMVSAIKCFHGRKLKQKIKKNSRFPYVLTGMTFKDLVVEGRTQFLSPNVTYTINLIVKQYYQRRSINFKYKLDEDTQYWESCNEKVKEDGWRVVELYQFTSYQNEYDFKIKFMKSVNGSDSWNICYFDGIEFRPVEQENFENHEDLQPLSNPDTDWKQNLPTDRGGATLNPEGSIEPPQV